MTEVAPTPAGHQRASIAEQAEEVGREIRMRERVYPDLVTRGRLKQPTADRKLAHLRDALRTLEFMGAHAEGLRLLIRFLQAHLREKGAPPTETEAALLVQQPAIRALLDAVPGATIASLKPIARPGDMTPEGTLEHEEVDA